MIDLIQTTSWEALNEKLSSGPWAPPAGSVLRVHGPLGAAVVECVLSTALFYSHKTQFGHLTGQTWAFEPVLSSLLKEGLQAHNHVRGPAGLEEWLKALPKETGFVLWNEDHPITGELFDCETVDRLCNDLKIISIAVSHFSHRSRARELRPYSLRICRMNAEITLSYWGSRVKSPPLFSHRLPWNEQQVIQALMHIPKAVESAEAVENFEKQAEAIGFRRWDFHGDRLKDRAVLWHPDRNAEALSKAVPGSYVVNRCQAPVTPAFERWWNPLPSSQMIAGLLVMDLAALKRSDTLTQLKGAVDSASFHWTGP